MTLGELIKGKCEELREYYNAGRLAYVLDTASLEAPPAAYKRHSKWHGALSRVIALGTGAAMLAGPGIEHVMADNSVLRYELYEELRRTTDAMIKDPTNQDALRQFIAAHETLDLLNRSSGSQGQPQQPVPTPTVEQIIGIYDAKFPDLRNYKVGSERWFHELAGELYNQSNIGVEEADREVAFAIGIGIEKYPRSKLLYDDATNHTSALDKQATLNLYRRAVRAFPNEDIFQYKLACQLYDLGNNEEAIREFEKFCKQFSHSKHIGGAKSILEGLRSRR